MITAVTHDNLGVGRHNRGQPIFHPILFTLWFNISRVAFRGLAATSDSHFETVTTIEHGVFPQIALLRVAVELEQDP